MRAALFIVLALTGCTSYSSGVESNWARSNVLHVSGSGNAFSSDGRIEDYVFLQAAEKALEAGYRYYVVAASENTGSRETFTTYSPYTTTVSGRTYGSYIGNSYHGSTYATATTTGGPQSYTYYFPGREAVFVMYDTKPPGYRPGQYYDVVEVYNDLGPKYLSNFHPIDPAQYAEIEQQPSLDIELSKEEPNHNLANSQQSITSKSSSSKAPGAARERTLGEIYNSLSEEEKFIADTMSPTERAQYLYNHR